MNPEEAVQAHLDVTANGSGLLVPIHWATFRLAPHPWAEPAERLLAAAEAAEVKVAIPAPGQRIDPSDAVEIQPVVAALIRRGRTKVCGHDETRGLAAVVVVLLALVGCGSGQPVSSPPSALSEAPPNEVSGLDIPPGRIDLAITKVDGLVNDLMKNTGIPGSPWPSFAAERRCTPKVSA